MRDMKAGILGASAWLARELIEWLQKWRFPDEIMLFDEVEECGRITKYKDKYYPLHRLDDPLLKECTIIFDCIGKASDLLKDEGCEKRWIIHLCSCDQKGKLLLPSLGCDHITKQDHDLRIPTAAFAMFAMILALIQTKYKVKQSVLTSLHSVAEVGDEGCKDLLEQLHAYVSGQEMESDMFPLKDAYQHLPLLFQVIPQTTDFCECGSSEEEMCFQSNLDQLFDQTCNVCATCVRVAGLRGLSMSLVFTCEQEICLDDLIDAFSADPSMICFDDITHNMYPICADVIHDYRVYVGRMRRSDPHTFAMWAVCDDLALRCAAAVKTALYIIHNFSDKE